jgi:formate hydrogenlyase subunit 6/NADH:ubiquinone oxidoreductase subunit I
MRLRTIIEIPAIMVKVLAQAIRTPWTVIYPREKRELPLNARGRHTHFGGGPQGTCIGCGRCARVCPNIAITVHRQKPREQSYIVIDYSRCIYCGYCVGQCQNSALYHLPDYSLSTYSFEELKLDEKELAKVDPDVLKRLQAHKEELPEGLQEALDAGRIVPDDKEKIKWRSKDQFTF